MPARGSAPEFLVDTSVAVALSVAGGAVYDALVGVCASEHGLVLATRDQRALEIYRALDVRVELVG